VDESREAMFGVHAVPTSHTEEGTALIIKLNNEIPASQEEPDAGEVRNQHSAEVIIFPGVRYERWGDMQSEPNDQDRSQDSNLQQGDERDWLKV
jgi:hypothetical protein